MLVPTTIAHIMEGKKINDYISTDLFYKDVVNTKVFEDVFCSKLRYSYYAANVKKPPYKHPPWGLREPTTGSAISDVGWNDRPDCMSVWRLSGGRIIMVTAFIEFAVTLDEDGEDVLEKYGWLVHKFYVTKKPSFRVRFFEDVRYHYPAHQLVSERGVYSARCDPKGVIQIKPLSKPSRTRDSRTP